MQDRNDLYIKTMSVGVGPWGRMRLKMSLLMEQTMFWFISGCLAIVEVCTFRVF